MHARLTIKPVPEVIAAIQALDLESVKLRIMHPERGQGWTRDHADSIENAYKNFLSMLVKYPDDAGDILLSEDVDEFWHAHILQTMKYADDCEHLFGNFLHHNPQIGEGSPERRAAQIAKTRRLYLREFGAQAADAAWTGGHAHRDATMQADKGAYCDATIRSAAYCDATVGAGKAAYCDTSVRSVNAAYCDATVARGKTAYCDVTVKAAKVAYCDASIRVGGTVYCDASSRPAAYCDASGRPKVAYCDAAAAAGRAMA